MNKSKWNQDGSLTIKFLTTQQDSSQQTLIRKGGGYPHPRVFERKPQYQSLWSCRKHQCSLRVSSRKVEVWLWKNWVAGAFLPVPACSSLPLTPKCRQCSSCNSAKRGGATKKATWVSSQLLAGREHAPPSVHSPRAGQNTSPSV